MSEKIKDKKNPDKENKKIQEKPKSPEGKELEKKVENIKNISSEGRKLALNNLKNEVKDIHFQNFIKKNIPILRNNFNISEKGLTEVITRESGFKKNITSETGAKGIMQLTKPPLLDIENKKTGAGKYMNLIKAIPDETINGIDHKYIRIALFKIKNGDKKDYNQNIGEITSKAKNNGYCNFIVGCIHLAKLKENANIDDMEEIISNLNKIKNTGIDEVNKLLKAKNKLPINKEDIADLIKKVNTNPEFYKNFISYVKYNGDNEKQNGISHKYLYATAIAKAKTKSEIIQLRKLEN
ncbi:MAG: transglycosylase SLT domain-containing protein [Candidatus Gracilibacteria bacterium]|nr:transglycosylase SLT domain-containing protein [Candidatus Gracilibacteria bacterium]